MTSNFYDRLNSYFNNVAKVLAGKAAAASIFPNHTDKGISREGIYIEFLENHLPAGCKIISGGFLFGLNGDESKQTDIIITADTCPQYKFDAKAFSCIDGTLAVVSVKSTLDTKELNNSLENFASLPKKQKAKINPAINIQTYDNWPLKILYASDGVSAETLQDSFTEFYKNNPVAENLKPDVIHVLGKYFAIYPKYSGATVVVPGVSEKVPLPLGKLFIQEHNADTNAFMYVIEMIQNDNIVSKQIIWNYNDLRNRLNGN